MTNGIYKTPDEFDRAIKQAASKAEGDAGERYRQALRDHGNAPRRVGVVQDERPRRRRRVRAYPVTIVRRIKRGDRKRVRPPLDGNTEKIQSP